MGRWDDLYALVGTKAEEAAFGLIQKQLALDCQCKTPSLLAKWLKSENASSAETKRLANKTRIYLGLSHKQYRKVLSALRERINVIERLMSANKWDEIEFDKIPSKAGFVYKNAFARRDIIKAKYEAFINDENTKVNAGTLYPYEVVSQAVNTFRYNYNNTPRKAIEKYWDNLTDYFKGKEFNGLAVVDTSGSMRGSRADAPINVAISLGMYCAEKAKGPFAGNYVSFSAVPQLIKIDGIDFVDKVFRIYKTNRCENTNIEATFDMLLDIAKRNHCAQEDLPQNIIIISDMEFDEARGAGWGRHDYPAEYQTLMEGITRKWAMAGYQMPHLIFWNVQARQDNIPMKDQAGITFVSGMSPVIFEQVMTGKTAQDLMYDKLDSERYAKIG